MNLASSAHLGSVARILQSAGDAFGYAPHPVDIRYVLLELEGVDLSTEQVVALLEELGKQTPPRALKEDTWRWRGVGEPGKGGVVDLSSVCEKWNAKKVKWTRGEFEQICALYRRLGGERVSESTIEIHELALTLRRRVRQVEIQLLMCRALDDPADKQKYKKFNKILKEVWSGRGEALAEPRQELKVPMNSFVKLLAGRGFGGEDAVVVLGQELQDKLPESDPPAGVQETLGKLKEALESGGDGPGEVVFLLGGPGNGKSHQAQSLLQKAKLSTDSPPDPSERAPRKLDFPQVPGGFMVVNDATIREGEKIPREPGELAKDIRSILSGKVKHALLCINRGILVEELAQLGLDCNVWEGDDREEWEKTKEVLEWLQQKHAGDSSPGAAGGYYQFLEKTGINLRGLFLDQLSLLERQPSVEPDPDKEGEGGLVPSPYKVAAPGSDSRLESPAAKLLSRILGEEYFEERECSSCPVQDRCPILANVKNLRSNTLKKSVIELLRAAEVASGQIFTYRDLWALLATLVAGPPRLVDGDEEPCSRVIRTIQSLGELGKEEKEQAYFELSCFRFYEAPFRQNSPVGKDGGDSQEAIISPGVQSLRLVDPVLDTTFEWAKPVDVAMQSVSFKADPLKNLAKEDPGVEEVLGNAAIDGEISEALLKELNAENSNIPDSARRRLMQWRGHSLYRLYGLCSGNYAYKNVVEDWLWARQSVVDSEPVLSQHTRLEEALRHLILPNSEVRDTLCFLPLLEPRVSPVIGKRNSYACCRGFQPKRLDWEFFTRGDSLLARLFLKQGGGQGEYLAEFHVDFPLCKEALVSLVKGAQGDSGCSPGFTDGAGAVSPRLERVRASFIAREALESVDGTDSVYLVGQREILLSID